MTPTRLMMGEKPIVVTNTTSYNYNQLEALYTEIGATVRDGEVQHEWQQLTR